MSGAVDRFPSKAEYQSALLHPERCLKDPRLRGAAVEKRALFPGVLEPLPRAGNFGSVYKLSIGDKSYALKVFVHRRAKRDLRYRLIHEHLAHRPSRYLVELSYDPQGITVQGRGYPTLLMEWASGELLDSYLRAAFSGGGIDNGLLCRNWMQAVLGLADNTLAHGDLQHGNVLVLPDGQFRFVDYDGMFVPAMIKHQLGGAEIGLPAYQHPRRGLASFNLRIDDFGALVILLTFAAGERSLWNRFARDDTYLLVSGADIGDPSASPLLTELRASPSRPVARLAEVLSNAAAGSILDVPLFASVVNDRDVRPALAPGWKPAPTSPAPARIRSVEHAPPLGTGGWVPFVDKRSSQQSRDSGPVQPIRLPEPPPVRPLDPPPPPPSPPPPPPPPVQLAPPSGFEFMVSAVGAGMLFHAGLGIAGAVAAGAVVAAGGQNATRGKEGEIIGIGIVAFLIALGVLYACGFFTTRSEIKVTPVHATLVSRLRFALGSLVLGAIAGVLAAGAYLASAGARPDQNTALGILALTTLLFGLAGAGHAFFGDDTGP